MNTNTIDIKQLSNTDDALCKAVETLNAGGLVAFPTETVYGLAAAAARPDALKRLAQLKNRPPDKPFTLHIGRQSQLSTYVPALQPLDATLLRKAWPGPLTAVFTIPGAQEQSLKEQLSLPLFDALYYEGSIGVRLPDHELARELLSDFEGPVVAPSANLAGREAPTSAQDVLDQLDGRIDLLLDAGPTRYRRSSTVVRLAGKQMDILREGIIDRAALERMRTLTILFICTGNTCRTPMAEGICRHQLAQKVGCAVDQLPKMGYNVLSAGVMAYEGAEASPEAVDACRQRGIDITAHRARPLTVDLINSADYIFVMSSSHRQAVLSQVPAADGRTALLAGSEEITDPIGMELQQYCNCAEHIADSIDKRLAEMFPSGRDT